MGQLGFRLRVLILEYPQRGDSTRRMVDGGRGIASISRQVTKMYCATVVDVIVPECERVSFGPRRKTDTIRFIAIAPPQLTHVPQIAENGGSL